MHGRDDRIGSKSGLHLRHLRPRRRAVDTSGGGDQRDQIEVRVHSRGPLDRVPGGDALRTRILGAERLQRARDGDRDERREGHRQREQCERAPWPSDRHPSHPSHARLGLNAERL